MPKIKQEREPSTEAKKLIEKSLYFKQKVWGLIKARNEYRQRAIEALISEGFTYREIGPLLGITGQMVGKLVKYWKQRVQVWPSSK